MSIPGSIKTPVDGVPLAHRPLHWDMRLPVRINLNVIDRWIGYYSPRLPKGTSIDEAAIMVPGPWHESLLAARLQEDGWANFNVSEDLVFTNPFGTRYFVAYSFFRKPDVPYRLEVMHMSEGRIDSEPGFSPLHASLWPNGVAENSIDNHLLPVPHLSFKPVPHEFLIDGPLGKETKRQTWRQAYSAAVQHLKDNACIHAQTCQSTYGVFGYYLGNDATRQVYVKPRVNTRDCQHGSECLVDHAVTERPA